MANGYSPRNYVQPKILAGIVTNEVVSSPFPITAGGSKYMAIKITSADVAQTGTLTVKLQTSMGNDSWVDSKSTTVTADGSVYIKLNNNVSGDQTYLPLLSAGRIVVTTTDAADEITVTEVSVLQEL